MKQIAILDYGLGNIRSVSNAFSLVGAEPLVSRERAVIDECAGLVIPGVGAFGMAMTNLASRGLVDLVHGYVRSGRPVLGICLGMQILFDSGTEFGLASGLGILPGQVNRIPVGAGEGRLPHIAWTRVRPSEQGAATLFEGLVPDLLKFYFVHSFAPAAVPAQVVAATATYCGHEFVAAALRENVWATQFHPEKSGPSGLSLISNFVRRC